VTHTIITTSAATMMDKRNFSWPNHRQDADKFITKTPIFYLFLTVIKNQSQKSAKAGDCLENRAQAFCSGFLKPNAEKDGPVPRLGASRVFHGS
jgi:hypothetical protein